MTKKLGRPKLAKGKAKAQFINLRFSPDEAKQIDAAAERAKQKRAKWARGTLFVSGRVDSRLNVTGGWSHLSFVASRFRLPSAVKNFLSLSSMFFFNSNGSSFACWACSIAFVASAMSGLSSSR